VRGTRGELYELLRDGTWISWNGTLPPLTPFSLALEYAVSAKTALRRRNVTLVLCALQPTLVKAFHLNIY
jgi:hypothetical protein